MQSGGHSPSQQDSALPSRKRSQQPGTEVEGEGATVGASVRAKKRQRPNGTSHQASAEGVDSQDSDTESSTQLVGLEGLDLDLFKKVWLSEPFAANAPALHADSRCPNHRKHSIDSC